MVCDQCKDLKTTSALLCKGKMLNEIRFNIIPFLQCSKCDILQEHKRFITLSKKYKLIEIMRCYTTSDIKMQLKTTKTKQRVNKYSIGYVNHITRCIHDYTRGRFYNRDMIINQKFYEERIREMKAKREINLKTFFIDFYKELCEKKWNGKKPYLWKNTSRHYY